MNLFICIYGNSGRLILFKDGNSYIEKELSCSGKEAESTLVAIDDLLSEAGFEISDVDKVMVVTGPGYFTAVRVAVMIANMLSFSAGISLIGINTFEYMKILGSGIDDVKSWILPSGSKDVFVCDCVSDDVRVELKSDLFGGVDAGNFEGAIMNDGSWISFDDVLAGINVAEVLVPLFEKEGVDSLEPTYFKGANITMPKK